MDEGAIPNRRVWLVGPTEAVAIAVVIAMALALVIPAINLVRAASDKTECGNRLRSLAIACHFYHGDHGSVPAGCWAQFPRNASFSFRCQNIGLLPAIMPYLGSDENLACHLYTTDGVTVPGRPANKATAGRHG